MLSFEISDRRKMTVEFMHGREEVSFMVLLFISL